MSRSKQPAAPETAKLDDAEAVRAGDVVTLRGLATPVSFHVLRVAGPCWILRSQPSDGTPASLHVAHVARSRAGTWVHVDGRTHVMAPANRRASARAASDGSLVAPMTGKVVEVGVIAGQRVEAGALVVALSAMKMRVELKAPFAGVVARLSARAGEQVEDGFLLAVIERAASTP